MVNLNTGFVGLPDVKLVPLSHSKFKMNMILLKLPVHVHTLISHQQLQFFYSLLMKPLLEFIDDPHIKTLQSLCLESNNYIKFSKMFLSEKKSRLPKLLAKLITGRYSIVLKRLILFDDNSSVDDSVGYYDHICEGISILVDFFCKKRQTLLLKVFSDLGQYPFGNSPITHNERRNIRPGTKRSYLSNPFTAMDMSPIKQASRLTFRTVKPQSESNYFKGDNTNRQILALKKLLSRVKLVNDKCQLDATFSCRQLNEQRLDHNYDSRGEIGVSRAKNCREDQYHQMSQGNRNQYNYQSQSLINRASRRKFIIDKFNKLESSLQMLADDPQQQNANLNILMKEIQLLKNNLRNRNYGSLIKI